MKTLEEKRQYEREYYKKNRNKKIESVRIYYLNHKRDCKSYYKKNKDKLLAATRKSEKNKEQKYGIGINTIYRYGLKNALEIYDKYDRRCINCGSENNLVIHHLDRKGRNYERMGLKPNNNIDNLVLLCNKCHGSIHGKMNKGTHRTFTEEHKRRISEGMKKYHNKLSETK